jgi:secondary thiamine-phosphate synthase enzyme
VSFCARTSFTGFETSEEGNSLRIEQRIFSLKPRSRGFHLITSEVEHAAPELAELVTGIVHLHILHTSASLTLNENSDPDVRSDLETIMNQVVPERHRDYRHTCEGADDMPAHAKSSILGSGLLLPVNRGRFVLGTWQGIYLCEHRNQGGARRVCITLIGS